LLTFIDKGHVNAQELLSELYNAVIYNRVFIRGRRILMELQNTHLYLSSLHV